MNPRRGLLADSPELIRYPLRQSVTATPEKIASIRDSGLLDWLSKPESQLLLDHGNRITICAAHETALEEATAVLAQAHGPSVTFSALQIHSIPAPEPGMRLKPVMSVRIQTRRQHAARTLEELVQRRATIIEEDRQGDRVVLRAEVRLADLLGLPACLREIPTTPRACGSGCCATRRPTPERRGAAHRLGGREKQAGGVLA